MNTSLQFTRGAVVGSTRTISAQDVQDLRNWLATYESSSSFGQQHRARVLQQYDQGTNQVGRRTGLWDASGHATWSYDVAGRLNQEQRSIDGQVYTSQLRYDPLDRLSTTTLPDGEALMYAYGTFNGLLNTLTSSLGTTLVSSVQYNALNQPTQYTLGPGGGSATATTTARLQYWGPDTNDQPPGGGTPYGALWKLTTPQPVIHRDD